MPANGNSSDAALLLKSAGYGRRLLSTTSHGLETHATGNELPMARVRIIVNSLAIAVIVFAGITLWSRSHAQHGGDIAADPLAILDRRVAKIDFAGTSLPEAAEALGKASGVRITIDPAAEIAARVDATGLKLDGITLEDDLRLLLAR